MNRFIILGMYIFVVLQCFARIQIVKFNVLGLTKL